MGKGGRWYGESQDCKELVVKRIWKGSESIRMGKEGYRMGKCVESLGREDVSHWYEIRENDAHKQK